MLEQIKRVIDWHQRPWARHEYQRFCGPYILDAKTGLYFDQETDEHDQQLVVDAFSSLPRPLQELCRTWAVTLSVCPCETLTGGPAAFYADFSQLDASGISPHIEISQQLSLQAGLSVPHLAHETSHLWWSTRAKPQRDAYRDFLISSFGPGEVEVTGYAQEKFDEWQKSLRIADSDPQAKPERDRSEKRWLRESFSETVAVLHVPAYPSYNPNSTVDLELRRLTIASLLGLELKHS